MGWVVCGGCGLWRWILSLLSSVLRLVRSGWVIYVSYFVVFSPHATSMHAPSLHFKIRKSSRTIYFFADFLVSSSFHRFIVSSRISPILPLFLSSKRSLHYAIVDHPLFLTLFLTLTISSISRSLSPLISLSIWSCCTYNHALMIVMPA
ncbi:hypothetical protein CC2G_000256 [Coprinopsis cinerea AmutBmut pab1-1]|nr:hypothetical protein CC2G_000256 [Coprinopsis cinerea AmutBmut pab1-1]